MKEVKGKITHRILLNYKIDADVMKRNLPPEFEPKLVNGYAIGGICQVSLSEMRPNGLPSIVGVSSHNAAHRIAVTCNQGEGVFVTRRDTNSNLNTFSSGTFFPGVYKKAKFDIETDTNLYEVQISKDNNILMSFKGKLSTSIPSSSVFNTPQEVSDFFLKGNIGWSKKENSEEFDTIELNATSWKMQPLEVISEYSSYFYDESKFPKGSVQLDSAMIMQNLDHSWISREELCQVCV